MTIQELAKRYAEKPTDERYKALRDKIYEEEQPANVSMSVIEDIKAEIQKFADDEWNQNIGNASSGLEWALEIIDKHISGKE